MENAPHFSPELYQGVSEQIPGRFSLLLQYPFLHLAHPSQPLQPIDQKSTSPLMRQPPIRRRAEIYQQWFQSPHSISSYQHPPGRRKYFLINKRQQEQEFRTKRRYRRGSNIYKSSNPWIIKDRWFGRIYCQNGCEI